MLPLPDLLQRERTLAHLIGGGIAAAVGTGLVLVPALRAAGIASWPAALQDLIAGLMGVAIVYGPVVAVLGIVLLIHLRLAAH